LIETRDPFDSADSSRFWELAGDLGDQSHDVTVYLVQNGVVPTRRRSTLATWLSTLASKATVVADDFSLRERGIGIADLADNVQVATIDALVELIAADGRKIPWH
jgi:sulfur transfer complex TusBCD TusB component (DsrH family)